MMWFAAVFGTLMLLFANPAFAECNTKDCPRSKGCMCLQLWPFPKKHCYKVLESDCIVHGQCPPGFTCTPESYCAGPCSPEPANCTLKTSCESCADVSTCSWCLRSGKCHNTSHVSCENRIADSKFCPSQC